MDGLLRNRRKTIGVLINSVDGFYQSPVWRAIKKVAEERDFNAFFFAGGALQSTVSDEAQKNVIYDLVNTNKLDGLIICSGLLLNYIGLDKFIEFIQRYRDIPMISMGIDIKDIPSVVFDNRNCMQLIVNHLIENHNYSKIAFITGTSSNPEAVMRFEGYKDALKKHNIPFDPQLIVKGDFHEVLSTKDIDKLMIDKNNRPEVIVATNDEMAIQVFYLFKEMGIEVGKDISLTGFDNVETGRYLSPRFTTVEQPIFEMASKSAEFIDLILSGQNVPQCTYLNGNLIIRESCGCHNILRNKTALTLKGNFDKDSLYYEECEILRNYLIKEQDYIDELVMRELGTTKIEIVEYEINRSKLFDAFISDIKAKKIEGEFIAEIKQVLFNLIFTKKLDYSWNEALYFIRDFMFSIIKNYELLRTVEEIFYLVSLLVSNIFNKRESAQQFNFKRMYIGTRDIMREFNCIQNRGDLTKVIMDALPWYGIKQCYLCVYDSPVASLREIKFKLPSKAKLILGYNQGDLTRIQYLNTLDILPEQFIYQERRNDLIFLPIVTGNDYFGYVVCDMNAVDEFIYETFREQISNTLKIQMLFDERIKAEEQLNLAVLELEKANGELKNTYVIDELTGVFNRRGFYMHGGNLYKSAAMTGGKVIMCFGDMDGLKKINDTYGHQEGDEAILTTALLLKESFGVDDIVSRIGGDEFTVITANKSTVNEINAIIENINFNFERYNMLCKKPYKLAISLGFSIYCQDMQLTFEELIQEADKQLYKQKKKNKYLV